MNPWLSLAHIFWESILHRKKIFSLTIVVVFAAMFFWIQKIPRKYQSTALFNFHSDFSKIPASSEFFSEMYDPNEIRAEKEAILLGVLSDQFLSGISRKYLGSAAAEQEWVVQGLRKDMRFVPLSRTTYQLVVVQKTPEIAQNIAWDVMEKLEESLRTERLAKMQSVYDSVTQQLNELTIDGQDKNIILEMQATRLRIENEIQRLESLYTAEHPKLLRLRSQLQSLRTVRSDSQSDPMERGHYENWASLRGILITRQALLKVAIRMEKNGNISHINVVKEPDYPLWPVEPKKNVLLASAAVTSVVIATALSALCSVIADLHALFPNLASAWRAYRLKIRELRRQQSTERDN